MKQNGQDLKDGFEKISEQVLNGIVQSIEAAVVLHDRKLQVVFVNDSFEKIFEIKGGDALGKSPMEFLPEFDKPHKKAIFTRLQNTLKAGVKSSYHEFPYYSPSGKLRYLVAISIPITNEKKEITHVMSVIHNITRRKELEKEAVKAARLSSIADMAYTLAHEINNPLTGIKLGLSTLYDSIKKEKNIQVLNSVIKDLNRIQSTVHAFLKARKNPSRMEKKKLSIIGDILDDVLFHLSGQLDLKNIKVTKKLSNGTSFIMIDNNGIHQVLLNVLLNAIQAIHHEGRIIISTKITAPQGDHASNMPFLRVSMTDTGVGIDAQKSDNVFKPFYSSKTGGTGLGLSICEDIISAHKGFMELKSDRGKGTTVHIYLPILGERVGRNGS